MTQNLDLFIRSLNLEVFVTLGSFIEEVFAPIPSPFIMTTAAVLAVEKQYAWWAFGVLALLGAFGKTLACWLVYFVADKSEDIVVSKFGRYFGVTHQQVERVGSWFSRGWWDEVILFVLRAVPLAPSFMISVVCGLIKTNLRSYLFATFTGTLVRNGIYLLIGIYGWETIQHWFFE